MTKSLANYFLTYIKVEEEERRIEAMLEAVERQNEEVVMQLQELELKTKHFQGLEERFV